MKRLDAHKVGVVLARLFFLGTLFLPTFLAGQTAQNGDNDPVVAGAGPRLGPVVVVEVTFPDRQALGELARSGYDISSVRDNVATIYASLEELERLKQTGYPLRQIEERVPQKGFDLMALGIYHDYAALTDELSAYAETNPDICRLHTLGQSVEGRELWAILITDNPDDEEDEPEFKYVSTMHGNESLGTEMCLYFIDLLLTEYGQDDRITNLINSTAIWIVPLMNPDGLEKNTRGNANGINLNRDFPLLTDSSLNIFTGGPLDTSNRQPETVAIMQWSVAESFTLAANIHTGSLLVCYPYGYNEQMSAVDTPAPDDLLFEDVSRRYTVHNPPMWNSSQFPDGIINAADWYPVRGAIDDWNYRYLSCNEVCIELSNNFQPSASQIPTFWSQNSESMLSFLEAVHIGVRGIISDRGSNDPVWAEVLVERNSQPVFTDPDVGDYHRMLLADTYNLLFYAPGYVPRLVRDIVVTDGPATRLDVELLPEQASPDYNQDGIVDIEDLEILIESWGLDEPLVDIAPLPDGDGLVDEEDLSLFMEYWQEEIPDPPDPSLVAHWKLDETEGDIASNSASGNDGILFGEPLWQPMGGKRRGALQFDGADDYVSTELVLSPADGAFSVYAWIKGGMPGQVILSQTGGANWLKADSANGHAMTELKGSGRSSGGPLLSSAIITEGTWHRICIVWDGSYRHLYVDGVEAAKDATPLSALEDSDGGLRIGTGGALEPGTFFSGLIDDVRVYNRTVKP